MKKIFLILLIGVFTIACSSDNDDSTTQNSIIGTWQLTKSEIGTTDETDDCLSKSTLTISSNGNMNGVTHETYNGECDPEEYSGTWEKTEDKITLSIDGRTIIFSYTLTNNYNTLTLSRSERQTGNLIKITYKRI